MARMLVGLGAIYGFGLAFYIWVFPQVFYDRTPGLAAMGPFSIHFMRDVALAHLAGGLILVAALVRGSRELAVAGSAWFALHAVFHIWIWAGRGAQADVVALTNWGGVIVPSLLFLWGAWRFRTA